MRKQQTAQGRKGQKGSTSIYDSAFRRMVAQRYQNTDESHQQVAVHFGVSRLQVLRWNKEFCCELSEDRTTEAMTEQEQKELDALRKQNKQLKEKLDHEQMRTFALETMIDLAKEKLGVDVRKNFGAKQPEE